MISDDAIIRSDQGGVLQTISRRKRQNRKINLRHIIHLYTSDHVQIWQVAPAEIGHDLLDILSIIANYIFTISATETRNRLVIHHPEPQMF